MTLLSVRDLDMHFGGLRALSRVSFEVGRGSVVSLIGPNGAGKTTVFNCITGFYRATSGSIRLSQSRGDVELLELLGAPLTVADLFPPRHLFRRLAAKMFGGSHRIARAGVARTFQHIRLFRELTSLENLLVAQHRRFGRNILAGLVGSRGFLRAEGRAVALALEWLQRFELETEVDRPAGELSYGQQRRLEIARALCTDPILLCLDEPAAGLNDTETAAIARLIRELVDQHGVTVLLIEHDMRLVMEISDHIVVLDHGEVIARGSPAMVQHDPRVLAAYLGTEGEGVE
ncbi:MAG: ATP-binding cassette domain-containing protein [Magnetococcales bacterium]|nr:ATP-binding cassette domain-containing protein [Magnetococcales bacterium]MBF0156233.1 ATP-binding cassette domain-containing protein [Magnetococcales bacterium]